MIFQTEGAIDKILKGEKTQARRLVKSGETLFSRFFGTDPKDYEAIGKEGEYELAGELMPEFREGIYNTRQTYTVQPGRGKTAVWYCALRTAEGVDYHILTKDDDAPLYEANARQLRIRILSIRREDVREISEDDARAEGYDSILDFLTVWLKLHDSKLYQGVLTCPDPDALLWTIKGSPDAERYDAWTIRFEVVK